ncbi:glucans biosynthesis glucosyltransferase MdoH [Oceanicola sp. 22II-s10i]|uniref:glucans biosynthesis glucosyltransferase MdoH n=1 Tax=Oceanicola sp. 22II-s10i TaxID=1317116 RepID=UPI000B528749|nr:glucans biosynthesis glucosyltransferase MdoH [Oceanicola sp. 22II-s10i]
MRFRAADARTRAIRTLAIGTALLLAALAAGLMMEATFQDGVQTLDILRGLLMFVTTGWLAWGAMLAVAGLWPMKAAARPRFDPTTGRTVVLVPICNEDPVATFARVAAIDASIAQAGVTADVAILSDTRDDMAALREREAFARLLAVTGGQGRIFYRRREVNTGRKAGNIEEFIRRSGAAYDYAVILDADSLIEGETVRAMIARMQADPNLGLLQTLPRILAARSFLGRALQFSAAFHSPVFTRGLARMQGATGPFWGHNAIVRVTAFAESCGLPALTGRPPFGGHILSHDYVEAALLARAGWTVTVDPTLDGSYEEGPENVLSYAKRDRRWCQGNLQHTRLLFAPGFRGWSRFVFLQGILAYVVSALWALFLVVSVLATIFAPEPNYFPDRYQLFPVFPDDRTREITALFLGIVGLLILPKLAIVAEAVMTGRARGFGGAARTARSVLAEVALTSLLAPVMMVYQTRAILQVLSGQDGGWPANARAEGRIALVAAVRAALWVSATGAGVLAAVWHFAPDLVLWLLPVGLPMLAAPVLIAVTSRPYEGGLFAVPDRADPPAVFTAYLAVLDGWAASASAGADAETGGASDVAA